MSWERVGHHGESFESIEISFARDEGESVPELDALFAEPRLSELRSLRIATWYPWADFGGHPSSDYAPVLAALTSRSRPSLATLVVDGFGGGDLQARSVIGDLSSIWKALPALQRLKLFGKVSRLGAIAAKELLELSLTVPEFEAELVDDLAKGEWPALEAMTLARWPSSEPEGAPLLPRLTGERFPRLRDLTLRNVASGPECVESLLAGPIFERLTRLRLEPACEEDDFDDDGDRAFADLIERNASRFAQLEALWLDNDRWNDDVCRRLVTALPCIEFAFPFPADARPLAGALAAEVQGLTVGELETSVATIVALENAGVERVAELAKRSPADLVALGLRRRSVEELRELLSTLPNEGSSRALTGG